MTPGIVRSKWAALGLAGGLLAMAWWNAGTWAQSAPAPSGPVVATVGKLTITRGELDARLEETLRQLRARTGADVAPQQRSQLRRQMLESLIWQRLVMLEAERRGVPPQSVADEYRRRAEPDRRAVERDVARKLTVASISYLPLRRSDYLRDPLPPDELAVLEWYRSHPEEFPRPPELHYSAIVIDQPPLPESQAIRADLRREWEALMQRRADSVLAAIRAGEPFDEAALRFGGTRRFVVAEGRPFHPDFRGTAAELAELQSTRAGGIAARPLPWSPGRALIRVDARLPKHRAPLSEVAGQILERLQRSGAEGGGEATLRAAYERLADSLRGPANSVRYAVIDTAGLPAHEPTPAEVERYYRLHLADFSAFDAEKGVVVSSPFEDVREGIRQRMVRDRRAAVVRARADRIASHWAAARRDARLEPGPGRVRDLGLVPRGSEIDTGAVARAIGDSLELRAWEPGTFMFALPPRIVVVQVGTPVLDQRPTFEQARPILLARAAAEDRRLLEAEGRRIWEQEPDRFRRGRTVYFSRLIVAPPNLLDIALDRSEVERRYRNQLMEYSAPPAAHVAHLLVTPSATGEEAQAEARRRAQELFERARSGEDWDALVKQYSSDEATRDRGGDVGSFGLGTMLPEFEAAAFQMKPGEIRSPIRTREGWHVLKCIQNLPLEATPLAYCWSNVAGDLAQDRANEIAARRADSLLRVLRSPSQVPAVAKRFDYAIFRNPHEVGDRNMLKDLVPFFESVEKTQPGTFVPMTQLYRGLGVAVAWVDSIVPARVTPWDEAGAQALDLARERRAERELRRRQASLDSLLRAGWSLDSLGALRGGLETRLLEGPGLPLVQLGGARILDSLVFGAGSTAPALEPGQQTGWLEFAGGPVRVRLDHRDAPDPVSLDARVSESWKAAAERQLYQLFEDLKKRHVVRIVDEDLAAIRPPVPPER